MMMWQRVQVAWQSIIERHCGAEQRNEDVVVVGHNGSIRALVCHLLGAPLQHYRRVRISNCGVTCVRIQNPMQPPLIEFVNETSHLSEI